MGGVSTSVITGSAAGLAFGLLAAAAAFAFAWQRRAEEYRNKEWRRISDLNDQKTQIDRLTAEVRRRTTEVEYLTTKVERLATPNPQYRTPDLQYRTPDPQYRTPNLEYGRR